MPHIVREERASRGPGVPLLLVLCGVLLLAAVAMVVRPVVFASPRTPASPSGASVEKRGIPGAGLQRAFRLMVPAGARDAFYLVVPGDGSADSGQDLYLRFRTNPVGLREFLNSLDRTAADLRAGDAVLEQDDIDSVGLRWRLGAAEHLVGLYVDIPEQGDTAGAARVAVDESEATAPVVYAHVTV